MAEQNPIRYQDLITPDDSIEKLIGQLEELQQSYTNMANSVKSQAQQVAESLRQVSGATEQGRKTLKESNDEAARLEKAYKKLDEALSANAKEIAKLNIVRREANNYNKQMVLRGKEEIRTRQQIKEASYQQLSAQYSLNKAYINTLSATERNTKANREYIKTTKEIYEQMKKLQEATGKHQLNVGNYPKLDGIMSMLGSQLGATSGMMGMLAGSTAAVTGAIGACAAAVVEATKAWAEYNTVLAEQSQIVSVTTKLQGEERDEMIAAARAMSKVYDSDFREIINAANTLMAQFGMTSDEAIQLLRDGMQGMIQGDGPKLLSMIQQFAPAFRDAGVSASQLVAVIQNSEGGIFTDQNMNAIVMGIKNIRLMTNATSEALAKLGIDGQKMSEELSAGTLTVFDALRQVSEALEQTNSGSQEAGEVMQQVFGRQSAMAGTNLGKAIAQLNTNLEQMKTQTGAVGESMAELNMKTEKFERMLMEVFGYDGWNVMANDIKTGFLDSLNKTLERLGDIFRMLNGIANINMNASKAVEFFTDLTTYAYEALNPIMGVLDLLGQLNKLVGGGGGGETKETPLTDEEKRINMLASVKGLDDESNDVIIRYVRNQNKRNGGTGGRGGGTKVDPLKEQQKQEQESLALRRKYEDLLLELIGDEFERERAKIALQYDRQKEDLQRRLDEDKKLTVEDKQVINQQIIALEEAKFIKLNIIWEKEVKKQQEADERKRKADEQARQLSLREQQKAIDLEYDIQREEIEQLEDSEKEKTRLRLEAEKERLQKLLALYEKDGKTLSAKEVELIKKQIQGINIELEKNSKDNRDIYDVLGFNLSEERKEAINTSLQYAQDALNSYMESYMQAAEAKRQAADAEVERTQSVLQAEIEARAKGYANEVDTARKEYENARKQQQKAIEQQKKAQKMKLLMDSISQVSNLVTATSLIWSQLGFPLAIPAIAVMWGSFAASKVMAASAVSGGGEEQYGEGHVELLDGGSHQSGNDIDLGRRKDGTRRRAEGGEFFAVINKRSSRKYRGVIPDVINSLNAGTFADKYLNAYDGGSINIQAVQQNRDLTRLSDDVHSIREQGEQRTFIDSKGRTVVIYKNVKRIIN